jgi:SulP family sulfate permease
MLAGIITVIASVSLAAMIFTGPMSPYLGHGVSSALVTAVVVGLFVSLRGSCDIAIAIPQDRTAPLLAIMVSAIVAGLPADMLPDEVFALAYSALILTTVITGLFLFGLGVARAGGLMRFVPYSVLAGFFAGTGWLLLMGGLRVTSGLDLISPTEFLQLLDPNQLQYWLPGVAIAFAIILVARLTSYAVALPSVMLLSTVVFFTWAAMSDLGTAELKQRGLLLGALEDGQIEALLSTVPRLLEVETWATLFEQWSTIGTILVISSLSILLTGSALELLTGEDVDVNRELRVVGLANLVAGTGAGLVGFHSLSVSSMVVDLGGRTRLIGIVAAATAAIALFFGIELIGYLPRPLLGGLLLFLGISFIGRWLFATWNKLPRGEYLVIPLILLVIAGVGFIEGVLAGLLAALLLFVLNYSKTSVIRHELFGDQIHSTVERNYDDERYLRKHGRRLYVLKLRGYLFFGTATHLSARVREQANRPKEGRVRFVLVDFGHVSGVDSSARYAFKRLQQTAEKQQFELILTGLKSDLQAHLQLGEGDPGIQIFADLDHGLEWCEDQLLKPLKRDQTRASPSILARLEALFPDSNDQKAFSTYLDEIDFPEGFALVRQGDAPSDVFFLETGEVSVYLESSNGERTRLRRTGAGTMIGEIGFYLGTLRSASVIADKPGTAFRLSREALTRMETERPEFAAALHQFMAEMLAERLLHITQTFEAVIQ